MSAQNYITYIQNVVLTLAGQHSALFQGIGKNMFLGLATIMLAWFGIKTALEAGDFLAGMHFSKFASLVIMISFGFAMINYYSVPIPGIGTDFHHLITNETLYLSKAIGNAQLDQIAQDVDYVRANLVTPGITDILAIFFYGLTILLLAGCEAVAIIVTAFGLVATSVCALVGPIFIPFFIVPKLDWLFWGWLRCFIQYAFYQVIAAAVIFIIGNFFTGIIHAQITGALSPTDLIKAFPLIVVTALSAIYAIIKIPMLTSHIFSGSAGGHALDFWKSASGGA
ncbi:MAG TPA: type IV secretion system protein [Terriglobia bacterium]|nr:type IV secretion system protein [Terriglobia bacterium]